MHGSRSAPLGKRSVHRWFGNREGSVSERIHVENHSVAGAAWFGGWLFTLGFLELGFWQGALAIVLWPYYLGILFG